MWSLYQLLRPHARSKPVSGSLLFRFLVKILGALKYFGLYRFSQRMGTDPVMTAMVFHWSSKVDCERTAVCDRFVLYELCTGEVYWLGAESV